MTAALEGGEWSAARPGRTLPPGNPVPILQEVRWAPWPVWTGGKSRPHRDSIPDRSARSQSLYRLSYPAHIMANGTVESGKEVIHTEGGGFTAFPKCRSRSSLHLVGTIHGLGTPKES